MVPDGLFPCLRLPYQSMNAIILLQFFCEKNSSTFKRRTADVVHDHLRVLITRILEIQELFRIYTVKMLHIFLCCLTFLLPSIFEGEATRGAISIEQHRHLRLFLVGFLFRFTLTEQKRNNFRAKMTLLSFKRQLFIFMILGKNDLCIPSQMRLFTEFSNTVKNPS